jgi:hypothetical protein
MYEIDDDLKHFFNTRIHAFKTIIFDKDLLIPWRNMDIETNSVIMSLLNDGEVMNLFAKHAVLAMKPFKRISRWTRFKQMVKGL